LTRRGIIRNVRRISNGDSPCKPTSSKVFGSFIGESVEVKLARAQAAAAEASAAGGGADCDSAILTPRLPFAIADDDVAESIPNEFGQAFRHFFHIDTDNWVFINHGMHFSYV
jgi:hypothetical protein